MKITDLPYNLFLGIKESENSEYILQLDDSPKYLNHLETVHASALFSLAEATSGTFLISAFSDSSLIDNVVPVVRKVDVKYKKPSKGIVLSKATFNNIDSNEIILKLDQKGRVILDIKVELFTEDGINVFESIFTWFVQKIVKEK